MSGAERDAGRAALERVVAESPGEISRAAQAVLRPLCGGQPWSSPYVQTLVDKYIRAVRQRAAAVALLKELDAIDGLAAGKTGGG